MANSGKFKKGAAASKGTRKNHPSPGAKSKAQGGTAHKMTKPEGSKGKLSGAMSKGRANMEKASKAVYGLKGKAK